MKSATLVKKKWDHPIIVTFFCAPAVMIAGGFIAYPAFMSAYYSFFDLGGPAIPNLFVGLKHWQRLFSDPIIWQCVWHILILIIVTVLVQIPLAFSIALILARCRIFGRDLYRIVFFFPVLLSVSVAGVLWSWVYNPQYGLINDGLRSIGLDSLAVPWLAKPELVLPAVIVVIFWKWIGLYIVIFMAGLASIPQDIYDAMSLDGTSLRQQAIHVVGPMLREVFTVTIAIGITASIKRFDLIYIMTMGGPVHYSEVLATYMYKQAFLSLNSGYASTIAFFLFILTLGMVVTQLHSMRQTESLEF